MRRRKIRQLDIDFLCLAVFGQRALPDDMAARIAIARGLAHGIADQHRHDEAAARQRGRPHPRRKTRAAALAAVG